MHGPRSSSASEHSSDDLGPQKHVPRRGHRLTVIGRDISRVRPGRDGGEGGEEEQTWPGGVGAATCPVCDPRGPVQQQSARPARPWLPPILHRKLEAAYRCPRGPARLCSGTWMEDYSPGKLQTSPISKDPHASLFPLPGGSVICPASGAVSSSVGGRLRLERQFQMLRQQQPRR